MDSSEKLAVGSLEMFGNESLSCAVSGHGVSGLEFSLALPVENRVECGCGGGRIVQQCLVMLKGCCVVRCLVGLDSASSSCLLFVSDVARERCGMV